MATEKVVTDAVDRAVETATVVDGEECRFDPDALAAVVRFCDSGGNTDRVMAVVDRALQRWVEGLDPQRVIAATVLRVRIVSATTGHPLRVESLQGDVGSGSGAWYEQD